MASTDDILDAWWAVEQALDTACPGERDSDKQIDRLQSILSDRDIDLAHRLRRQRNGMIHRRVPIRNSDAFVSESARLARLIGGRDDANPPRLTRRWPEIAGIALAGLFALAEFLDAGNPQFHAALGPLFDWLVPGAFIFGIACVVVLKLLP